MQTCVLHSVTGELHVIQNLRTRTIQGQVFPFTVNSVQRASPMVFLFRPQPKPSRGWTKTELGMTQQMDFKRLLFLSLLTGSLAISTRWTVLPLTPATGAFVYVSAALFVPWAALQAIALWKFSGRGLWLLTSLPLIAFWPAILYSLAWSCSHGNRNGCI
jgi:hypothetical protein